MTPLLMVKAFDRLGYSVRDAAVAMGIQPGAVMYWRKLAGIRPGQPRASSREEILEALPDELRQACIDYDKNRKGRR